MSNDTVEKKKKERWIGRRGREGASVKERFSMPKG